MTIPSQNAADEEQTPEAMARLRKGVYVVLMVLSVGQITGRIFSVNSVDMIRLETRLKGEGRDDWQKQRPFLSSNDRSRWCTVRSLVEFGTYAIDEIVHQPNWDTIDIVKHDEEGNEAPLADEGQIYSSKPPLLATIMAGEYWVIHQLTGETLGTHPYAIGRFMVWTINVIPLIFAWWMLASWVERFGATNWGRIFVMVAATFATFLSTFAVVVNNHIPAAVAALGAITAARPIWFDRSESWRYFILAGIAAGFTAACEMPGLSLVGLLFLMLFWRNPAKTVIGFSLGVLLVAAPYFATNYLAHHSLRPPYMHREEGDNWYRFQFNRNGKVIDSYWGDREKRSPIDRGEPEVGTYVLHALVGHHGIFSLTPIWLLAFLGLVQMCFSRDSAWRGLGAALLLMSVVCIAFYLSRPLDDRNYGGMTSGFRWIFWFVPLWLVALIPAADTFSRNRIARGLALLLLACSALAVSYPTWNPWTQPWLYDFLSWLGLATLGGG